MQAAFEDARHAEAEQVRSTTGTSYCPRPSSVSGSDIVLAPDDLVTANGKHWPRQGHDCASTGVACCKCEGVSNIIARYFLVAYPSFPMS